MIFERLYLQDEPKDAYIDAYIPDPIPGLTRKSILIIPGGGYISVQSGREGEPIALSFLEKGFNAFVLHYSVGSGNVFPTQLVQASKAMCFIRENADKFHADNKVYAIGFSAGGHLAGSLAVLNDRKDVLDAAKCEKGMNRPDGALLIYPVVTGKAGVAHDASICNLYNCETPTDAQRSECSLEEYVNEESSPLFLLHTANDQIVSVRNSLLFADAYAKAGKTFYLCVYPDAPHGISLGNEITMCNKPEWNNKFFSKWIDDAVEWINQL